MSDSPTASSTPATAGAVALPALDNTLGAVLIGTFVSLVLLGVLLHQCHHYFVSYPKDKIRLKLYVITVLLCELVCGVLTMQACYFYMVQNYFNPLKLNDIVVSVPVLSLVGSLTIIVTQSFFCYRVWIIGKKWRFLVIFASILMLLEFVLCIVAAIKGFEDMHWDAFSKWTFLISIHNAASTVSDLVLTAVLINSLRKSRTGITKTDGMLNTLTLYAISTGLLTGVYNAVCFATAVALPHDLIYIGTVVVGVRLYSNSLLAALNSRRAINDRLASEVGVTDTSPFGVSGVHSLSHGSVTWNRPTTAMNGNVTVEGQTTVGTVEVLELKSSDYHGYENGRKVQFGV